jgi:preprotein translocase subunit YajC
MPDGRVYGPAQRKMMMDLITPAFAQTAGAASSSATELLMQMAPFGIIIVIMYFLILRPQQKRQQAHQDLIANIRRGDIVVTSGGLIGKVARSVDDGEIELEIAPNVKVRLVRQMITDVRAKGEPV